MQYGLSDQTLQKIRDVFVRYPQVEEAVLYGSRARGDYKNGSDIDLTLRGSTELTHTILSRIANDLDDQLLPYTIDLSIFKNIRNPEMIEQIKRVGVALYKK
ncbi:MAG: nucleotidyltransferase domain-containing protein [Candidatus Poribacteria bacterium]|nr:nucleotidyltransferase domain-containing protein [Candidatus Poribacteria bacterium]MDD9976085.1 nucleotidyltransferase domain-containing protein [Candidatus Poribacteria bacterium]MDE0325539.1 nucleotidyltransferase domain-containing protein [Candidatus Poribacteria bacterium]